MVLWRLILAFIALTYTAFGFLFLFNPDAWSSTVSIAFSAPAGRTDFRATYGGLEFGVGVFLLLCALRREFVRLGLFASACALVAMAAARSTGLLLDGLNIFQTLVAATEWIGGGLATWGAVMARPDSDSVPTPLQDPTPDEEPATR
jgi:hypothetical protein